MHRLCMIFMFFAVQIAGHNNSPNIAVMVPPYYHFEFPTIDVGKYSRGLSQNDSVKISRCIRKMSQNPERLTVEQQFVAAIRLFDMGDTCSAVKWFFTARYRTDLFKRTADPKESFEIHMAHVSFLRQTGREINKIAYDNPKKLAEIVSEIADEQKGKTDLSLPYPNISFIDNKNKLKIDSVMQSEYKDFISHLADIK